MRPIQQRRTQDKLHGLDPANVRSPASRKSLRDYFAPRASKQRPVSKRRSA